MENNLPIDLKFNKLKFNENNNDDKYWKSGVGYGTNDDPSVNGILNLILMIYIIQKIVLL